MNVIIFRNVALNNPVAVSEEHAAAIIKVEERRD
jgi:hypothetical protein